MLVQGRFTNAPSVPPIDPGGGGGGSGFGGSKLTIAGHSFVALSDAIIPPPTPPDTDWTNIAHESTGDYNWARWRTGGKFRCDIWGDSTATIADATAGTVPDRQAASAAQNNLYRGANFGQSSDSTTGINFRLQRALNTQPAVLLYWGGGNQGGVGAGFPGYDPINNPNENDPNVVIANWIAAGTLCKSMGVPMILALVSPRTNDTFFARTNTLNAWARANCVTIDQYIAGERGYLNLGMILYDTYTPWVDPTNAPNPYVNYVKAPPDGIHPTTLGALAFSDNLVPIINGLFSSGAYFDTDPRRNNLLANGNMTGDIDARSTASFRNVHGRLPTGFLISDNAFTDGVGSVSAVTSLETNPATGGQSLRIDITSTGAIVNRFQGFNVITPTVAAAGIAPTDWVETQWQIRKSASGDVMIGFELWWGEVSGPFSILDRASGAVANTKLKVFSGTATRNVPSNAESWALDTNPWLQGARGDMRGQFIIYTRPNLAGSYTIWIDAITIRKTPDPHTTFPFTTVIPPLPGADAIITDLGDLIVTADGFNIGFVA